MRSLIKNFLIVLLIFLIIAGIFSAFSDYGKDKSETIGIETLISQINNEEIDSININGDELAVKLKDGKQEVAQKETGESFSELIKNYSVNPEKVTKIKIEIK